MWLTGRLMTDFKNIADFRKDNGKAIHRVRREFIELCLSLLDQADKEEPSVREMKVPELKEKIASLQARMRGLKKREGQLLARKQIEQTRDRKYIQQAECLKPTLIARENNATSYFEIYFANEIRAQCYLRLFAGNH